MVSVFSYKTPRIEHQECIFNGGSECRYVIRWQSGSTAEIKRWRDFFVIGTVILNLFLIFTYPVMLSIALPASLIVFLVLTGGSKLAAETHGKHCGPTARLHRAID